MASTKSPRSESTWSSDTNCVCLVREGNGDELRETGNLPLHQCGVEEVIRPPGETAREWDTPERILGLRRATEIQGVGIGSELAFCYSSLSADSGLRQRENLSGGPIDNPSFQLDMILVEIFEGLWL
ncbi:unnamed protein product [Clonostachys rosea f. rosea IK726]|uniref:Uncharacterized protein n=1 Tax=Clonostachys rosea f. rosea IK726 TaxID=1349383 RepID=A0ACA9UNX4_BIOOC|nr:unnamed protein product [Clonostachys rosea f. rosea IK726]